MRCAIEGEEMGRWGIEGCTVLFLSGRDGCEWPVHYLTELRDL